MFNYFHVYKRHWKWFTHLTSSFGKFIKRHSRVVFFGFFSLAISSNWWRYMHRHFCEFSPSPPGGADVSFLAREVTLTHPCVSCTLFAWMPSDVLAQVHIDVFTISPHCQRYIIYEYEYAQNDLQIKTNQVFWSVVMYIYLSRGVYNKIKNNNNNNNYNDNNIYIWSGT